jgi:ketosteroid isomerase-like protein
MDKEKELLDAFHRFQNALVANDIQELDRLIAPDYRGFSLRGELEDRDAVLRAWKPGGVSMEDFSYTDLRVDIRGDVGILTGRGFVGGTYQGHRWEHNLRFCDLYSKTEEGWKIFLSHSVELAPGPEAESYPEGLPSHEPSTG